MLVKVAPDPLSMLEVSDNAADNTGLPGARMGNHSLGDVCNFLVN